MCGQALCVRGVPWGGGRRPGGQAARRGKEVRSEQGLGARAQWTRAGVKVRTAAQPKAWVGVGFLSVSPGTVMSFELDIFPRTLDLRTGRVHGLPKQTLVVAEEVAGGAAGGLAAERH